jgi:CheY-like chemotaxis protein
VPPVSLDALTGRRITLLEEDAGVQQALGKLLGRIGAEVTTVGFSTLGDEEVLQSILRSIPDVVLLDLRLASSEGRDFWSLLRTQVPALARRVVFLTTLGPGDPQWERARQTDQPILSKPLDVAALARAVSKVSGR